ncbi:hypothetical protein BZA05DRAFT_51389 [Tricharina praecox]|uniref:uncharacterized protein n=1 Tax=Tricharina praecox TaxID=43433 RepID=UPI0022212A1F|nr:uncharacterized protein BZA05DRAFT_51389 [Tricharina praecox]KAI5850852.1 hypothetical protein BZA05DRAFT_51389 [Tricharina praecox]
MMTGEGGLAKEPESMQVVACPPTDLRPNYGGLTSPTATHSHAVAPTQLPTHPARPMSSTPIIHPGTKQTSLTHATFPLLFSSFLSFLFSSPFFVSSIPIPIHFFSLARVLFFSSHPHPNRAHASHAKERHTLAPDEATVTFSSRLRLAMHRTRAITAKLSNCVACSHSRTELVYQLARLPIHARLQRCEAATVQGCKAATMSREAEGECLQIASLDSRHIIHIVQCPHPSHAIVTVQWSVPTHHLPHNISSYMHPYLLCIAL